MLAREDFNNDNVDAGDIGAGHIVTAIYEIMPVFGAENGAAQMDPLRYEPSKQSHPMPDALPAETVYAYLKIRYKLPQEDESRLIEHAITMNEEPVNPVTRKDMEFAVAVASFGQILKGGKYAGRMNMNDVVTLAEASKGSDPYGYYQTEFIEIARKAKILLSYPEVTAVDREPILPRA